MNMLRFSNTTKLTDKLTPHSPPQRSRVHHSAMVLLFVVAIPVVGRAQVPEPHELKRSGPRVTITNLDLEPMRRKRLAADAADEKQRKDLGLPSREEIRRRQEEQDRRLFHLAQQYDAERREADALRAQVDDLNAKLAAQNSYPVQAPNPYQSYWPTLPTTTTVISDWDPYQRPTFGIRIPLGNRRGYGYRQRYGRNDGGRLVYSTPRTTGNRRR